VRIFITSLAAAILFLAPSLFADVAVELKTVAVTSTTQPAIDESTVSVVAVLGHEFKAKFQKGTDQVEISGTVKVLPDSKSRVTIDFAVTGKMSVYSVSTTAEVKMGEPIDLSGSSSGAFSRKVVLTLKPA